MLLLHIIENINILMIILCIKHEERKDADECERYKLQVSASAHFQHGRDTEGQKQ